MSRVRPSSLRVRLLLPILLALAPALGLVLYTDLEDRRQASARAREIALRMVRLASADHERLIDTARQLLTTLAELPQVRPAQAPACQALLAGLLRQHRLYANLGAIGPDGVLYCSALPQAGPVYAGDRAYFQRAVQSRAFAVGDQQFGRVTRRATINFGHPLLAADGRLEGVVFAALELAWLAEYAGRAALPAGAELLLVDGRGTILVRHPEPERWAGRPAGEAPIVRALLAARGEGTTEAAGPDGVARLFAFTTLGGEAGAGRAHLAVGLATAAVFADADRALLRNLAVLLLVALLALGLALAGAQLLLLRPVHRLLDATRRLAAGDLGARTGRPAGRGELGELAGAFDEMAEALERAEARRRADEALRQRNFELEQQNRAVQEAARLKGEFVSVVSHELRAPLASIQGYVELLLEGQAGPLAPSQREALAVVQRGAERLLALIQDLLDLARIEAGRLELEPARLDLRPLIREVADSLRPLLAARRQRLTLDLPDTLPPVWADGGRIAQALTNLLSNAHKYTPEGGQVTVAAAAGAGVVRVEVTDTGVGLTPEEQAQLFTRFFRARGGTGRDAGGTGLGLVITRSLVELHGGQVAVTSAPGAGSTFTITLPAAPPGEGSGQVPGEAGPPAEKRWAAPIDGHT